MATFSFSLPHAVKADLSQCDHSCTEAGAPVWLSQKWWSPKLLSGNTTAE